MKQIEGKEEIHQRLPPASIFLNNNGSYDNIVVKEYE
jgi:hypothetical protein